MWCESLDSRIYSFWSLPIQSAKKVLRVSGEIQISERRKTSCLENTKSEYRQTIPSVLSFDSWEVSSSELHSPFTCIYNASSILLRNLEVQARRFCRIFTWNTGIPVPYSSCYSNSTATYGTIFYVDSTFNSKLYHPGAWNTKSLSTSPAVQQPVSLYSQIEVNSSEKVNILFSSRLEKLTLDFNSVMSLSLNCYFNFVLNDKLWTHE